MNIDETDAVRQVVEMAYGGKNAAMYLANIVENFSDKTWDARVRTAVATKMVEYNVLLQRDAIEKLLALMADDPCPKVRECAAELLNPDEVSHKAICEKLLMDSEDSVVQAAIKVKKLATKR